MRKLTYLFFSISLLIGTSSYQQMQNTLSKQEIKDGWKLLFDGKTTNGWHKYGGSPIGAAWKVADGALYLDTAVKNSGGDICTTDEFNDFDLKCEWKISKEGNSGVMFYVHEDSMKYKWTFQTGPEMQVLDNISADDNKKENHLAGALYDLLGTAADSKPKPVGEWNQVEIKCKDGKLDLYLNGINIVSTTMWDDNWEKLIATSKFKNWKGFGIYKTGHIDLQDHGYGVWFRNIKIKKL